MENFTQRISLIRKVRNVETKENTQRRLNNNNVVIKHSQGPSVDMFPKKRDRDGQQVHKKMLSITSHQGNANQKTTMRCHLTPVRMAASKRQELTSIGEDVEKRNSLYTVVGDVNWCSPCGKQYRGVSESQKENNHMIQQLQF